jgi:Na+/melibiose symporter-like transporter
MASLFLGEPTLRLACLMGACVFGAFSAFWTTLPFLIEQPPYDAGPAAAGLVALLGVAGALGSAFFSAPLIDRFGPRVTSALAITCLLIALVLLGFGADQAWILLIGVNLLNVGQQTNTVYMVSTFSGGALGSLFGSWAWSIAGSSGVCLLGGGLVLIATAGFLIIDLRAPVRR